MGMKIGSDNYLRIWRQAGDKGWGLQELRQEVRMIVNLSSLNAQLTMILRAASRVEA